ncbi:MAG: hypothetical protein F3743_07975 [Nitrospinae bacterium]|nr:hypothetical protein [Nitrospinota bacterium]MZH05326.1 hypothetical protein [Nitrospinota bacterium]MZH13409.1 hypothetical protein [Nitrospinota bacterium]
MIHSGKIKISVSAVFVFLIFSTLSHAFPGAIVLNPLLKNQGQPKVYQNAYVEISNSFDSVLYDITVTETPSQKRVLSIADFQSGQSFEMSFSKAGEYEICYSSQKDLGGLRTCLHVDVLKAKLI